MKRYLFYFVIVSLPVISNSQVPDDGFNYIERDQYQEDVLVARKSILLLPGFDTESHTSFLAYINQDLPFYGGNPVTNGSFNLNYLRVYQPINDNATSVIPGHNGLNYEEWSESITYFDGFGREIQQIDVKASPQGADVIKPFVYDEFGRKEYDYLSYAITQDGTNGPGGFRPDPISETTAFYETFFENEGLYSKSTNVFENSGLNRIFRQYPPGFHWNSNPEKFIEYKYDVNDQDEVIEFNMQSNDLVKTGYYPSGELFKNTNINEDFGTTIEYKNKIGQVVLVKTLFEGNVWLETYYIYDDFELLRYVIPPKATMVLNGLGNGVVGNMNDNEVLQDLCYYYDYDERKRNIEKKLPGSLPVVLVYDKRNRLVLSQDGNMRQDNKWLFNKYDMYNRVVLTGIYHHSVPATQEDMKNMVYANNTFFESFDVSNMLFGGYTNDCFPVLALNDEIHTITYYDNYQCLENSINAGDYAFKNVELDFLYAKDNDIKGKVAAFANTVIGQSDIDIADDYLLNVNYYDKYGRMIQTIADNHKGGWEIVSDNFNFSGDLLETRNNHNVGGSEIIVHQNLGYDHAKRLKYSNIFVNDQNNEVTLAHHTYNELGQLKRKKLHTTTDGASCLQCVDYKYNIRDWLTDINNIDMPGIDFFSSKLYYETGSNPKWNGNISAMQWKSLTFDVAKKYVYNYNMIDMLKSAAYEEGSKYDVNLTYDYNGNIQSLSRNGQLGESGSYSGIDALSYSYDGNHLLAVNDNNDPDYQNNGFSDNGSFENNEYFYDNNGNLTQDLNKRIENIDYTYNNMPQSIELTQDKQQLINFAYDAMGKKLAKQTKSAQAIVSTTEYIGNLVYENGELAYLLTSEGRVVPEDESYNYQYYLKDHLGNTRVLFDQEGAILQDNSYYPFGMQLSGLDYTAGLSPENKYLYNGKEMQDDFGLGWYDYGARFYDVALGRWHVLDLEAENNNHFSPFVYGFNNPNIFIDPDGRQSIIPPKLLAAIGVKVAQYNNKIKNFVGNHIDYLQQTKRSDGSYHSANSIDAAKQGMLLNKVSTDINEALSPINDNVDLTIGVGYEYKLSDYIKIGANAEIGAISKDKSATLSLPFDAGSVSATADEDNNTSIVTEILDEKQTYGNNDYNDYENEISVPLGIMSLNFKGNPEAIKKQMSSPEYQKKVGEIKGSYKGGGKRLNRQGGKEMPH